MYQGQDFYLEHFVIPIMPEELIFSVCGILCNDCEYYKGEKSPRCQGCEDKEGRPLWGECKLYFCAKEQNIEHCGLCKAFPCDKFIDLFDPSQGQISSVVMAGVLVYRAKHGDKKTVELLRKIHPN